MSLLPAHFRARRGAWPRVSAGFSIVEALVALGILTFGVFGIYEQFMQAHARSAEAETAIQARLLAHAELERLLACPSASLRAAPPFAPMAVPDHLRFFYRPTLTPRPDGLIAIAVQVGWDTPMNEGFQPGKSARAEGLHGL